MTNLPPPITHEKVQVVMTIENGQVIDIRRLSNTEMIASMNTFLWMAKQAGWQVIAPNQEAVSGTNSNSHS